MTDLVKATLCELSAGDPGSPVGVPVEVQFNPTTLRVSISNKSAGGQQAGSQARQRPGTGEMQVSFDLIFDTADEGTAEAPLPVTRKTMIVEKFVRPRGNTPAQQSPPRVQFLWGTFLIQGVMESANTDLELFSANGTPLRAKVSVSIKGQDPQYRYDPLPPSVPAGSAGGGAGNTAPGAPGTTGGAATPDKVAQALPGESLQQLAARNGLDPSAWRALAAGLANPLSLSAGLEIALPAALKSLNGPNSAQGRDPSRVAGSLPLVGGGNLPAASPAASKAVAPAGSAAARGAPNAQPANAVAAGQAVAGQGGLAGAIGRVKSDAQKSAVADTKTGFGLAPDTAAPAVLRPFGLGVPLRELKAGGATPAPYTPDPTVPGWQALPLRAGGGPRKLNRLAPRDACACDCSAPRKRRV
ncbi:MAG: hypothetical protein JNJ60_02550 [Rhodocyclaceae bacterium]|nr:hypothetical protein [Rhodocyclaceae bacterium]